MRSGRPRFRRWFLLPLVAVMAAVDAPPALAEALPEVPAFEPAPAPPSGDPTDEVYRAVEAIGELVDSRPTEFTGVRITGEGSLVVAMPSGAGVTARQDAVRLELSKAAVDAATSVTFSTVRYSRAELDATKERLVGVLAEGRYPGLMTGVGEDASQGVVVVYTIADSDAVRVALKSQYGDAITFRQMNPLLPSEADRNRDSEAHFGGAGFFLWNTNHTAHIGFCSTAFPVDISGVRYMLTAGHCLPSAGNYLHGWATAFTSTTQPAPTYWFGTKHTTTMGGDETTLRDSNQDRFGDWALLRSSTYFPAVYTCPNVTGTCTSATLGAAAFTVPGLGSQVCTSGRRTGQLCRQFVVDSDAVIPYGNGVNVNHITIVASDQNRDGVYECVGARGGDSGGAVYNSIGARPGFVRALGIYSATEAPAFPGDICRYAYTRLTGLRAWSTTATIPVF